MPSDEGKETEKARREKSDRHAGQDLPHGMCLCTLPCRRCFLSDACHARAIMSRRRKNAIGGDDENGRLAFFFLSFSFRQIIFVKRGCHFDENDSVYLLDFLYDIGTYCLRIGGR